MLCVTGVTLIRAERIRGWNELSRDGIRRHNEEEEQNPGINELRNRTVIGAVPYYSDFSFLNFAVHLFDVTSSARPVFATSSMTPRMSSSRVR